MNYLALEGQLAIPFADAGAIAERIAHYFQSVAALNPLFSRWVRNERLRQHLEQPAALTWPPDQGELRAWVNDRAMIKPDSDQHIGYSIPARTLEDDPIRVDFWLSIDFTEDAWWFFRRICVTFFAPSGDIWSALQCIGQNPIAFGRQALLDLGTIWDCDWAGVYGGDFRGSAKRPPNAPLLRYKSGWMVYLDRVRAARVDKPEGIKVEKLANGGALFTTVNDRIFDGRNADHWAAAARLQAALAPLNEPDADAGK